MTELEQAMLRAWTARHADEPDAEAVAKTEARLDESGRGVVAAALDGNDYLVGGRFTIADVVMGGVLDSARKYELLPDSPLCTPTLPASTRARRSSAPTRRERDRAGRQTVSVIVQKYGGTSVADSDRIKNVAKRVSRPPRPVTRCASSSRQWAR